MKKAFLNLLYFLLLFVPAPVFAQEPPQISGLVAIVANIFGVVMPVGQVLAVIMIIYGGYMWMISGGDPSRIKSAQGTLTWSVLGLIFLSIFKMILNAVFNFLLG